MARDVPPVQLTTERLLLTLPGPRDASRMVSYFETNRTHLTPWEPPFPEGLFTKAFWQRRLVQNRQEFQAGRSLRLVLFDRFDAEGPVLG
ncbi:MAG: alanine acetyltransferase, partial [Myxococcota bacterium]